MAEMTDVRETVRERYAAAAKASKAVTEGGGGCGCGPAPTLLTDEAGRQVFGGALYGEDDAGSAPEGAVNASLAAACQPRSPSFARARRCSTWARAVGPTS